MIFIIIKIKKQVKNSSGYLNAKWRAFWVLLLNWALQLNIMTFCIESNSSDCLHKISCMLCLFFIVFFNVS